uniref:ABC transmembrane type-1 domain-containing protein n=1 Tax=Rhabditophanes sp. KR3021 TaxID=114890 RepID=A0AC35U176_9BILA
MFCNAQHFELKRYKAALDNGIKFGVKKAHITSIFNALYIACYLGLICLIFRYDIHLILDEGECAAVADEVISGIRTAMFCNAQHFELKRYKAALDNGIKFGVKKAHITSIFNALYIACYLGLICLIFRYDIHLILDEGITIGVVFATFWIILIGAVRFGIALGQLNYFINAKKAIQDLVEVIDCTSGDGIKLDEVKGQIKFDHVNFTYLFRPENKIVNDISFEIEAGKKIGIVENQEISNCLAE